MPNGIPKDKITEEWLNTKIVAPKFRKGVPCNVEGYCSKFQCNRRVSGQEGWGCLRKVPCKERGYIYDNEDIPVGFCYNNNCPMLRVSNGFALTICRRFHAEIRRPTSAPSGASRLRNRWKMGGFYYRDVK